MKVIASVTHVVVPEDPYLGWVGELFICPVTDRQFQIDLPDIKNAVEASKSGETPHLVCPDCQAAVSFASDQRDGHYLLHEYKR
ncbi:hypothetical protein KBA63_03310 [Candidatus Woesebacteria bacterium]|jgi:hypothetical protein|nr:hypothetical protein [Candidatus Woesebacteria bacterium]